MDSTSFSSSSSSENCTVPLARRRLAAAVVAIESFRARRQRTGPRLKASRKDWQKHVSRIGHLTFRKMYRVDVISFNVLLDQLRSEIETVNVEMANRSSGSEVCAEVRLAITLRYAAGGVVWDIHSNFGISSAEFYRSVWRTMDVVNNKHKLTWNLSDTDRLRDLEEGFAKKSRLNAFRGVVGALDGCLISQKNPGIAVPNPNRYYCARKHKYSLLLMAICDANRKFIWFDVSCTPTTHDSLAWVTTELAERVRRGDLPYPYYILGDSAFTCTRSVITPGKDDNFNFEQSSLRINIECAFGELLRRWGLLWRPLEMVFEKRAAVVGFCIRMHNYCVTARLELEKELKRQNGVIEISPGVMQLAPFITECGAPAENLHNECHCESCVWGGRNNGKTDTSRRTELEQVLNDLGLVRPYRRQ